MKDYYQLPGVPEDASRTDDIRAFVDRLLVMPQANEQWRALSGNQGRAGKAGTLDQERTDSLLVFRHSM